MHEARGAKNMRHGGRKRDFSLAILSQHELSSGDRRAWKKKDES